MAIEPSPALPEIRAAVPADFPAIQHIAQITWRTCFPGIISPDQIEYMLAQRYSPEAMAQATRSGELTFLLLTLHQTPRAFAAYGPTSHPGELKLHQLYVLPEDQRRGFGRQLIRSVADIARSLDRSILVLTVNRHNLHAQAAYARAGFTLRESICVDIGHGFVMDDHVLELRLT